jgi:hypothetical protein
MYKISHRIAKDLMVDDKFKMAGQMYQVSDTSPNVYGEQILWIHPLGDSDDQSQIITKRTTPFKIYTQK